MKEIINFFKYQLIGWVATVLFLIVFSGGSVFVGNSSPKEIFQLLSFSFLYSLLQLVPLVYTRLFIKSLETDNFFIRILFIFQLIIALIIILIPFFMMGFG